MSSSEKLDFKKLQRRFNKMKEEILKDESLKKKKEGKK